MLFKTGLFSKRTAVLYFAGGIILAVIISGAYFIRIHNQTDTKQLFNESVNELLIKSDSSLGNNTELAEIYAIAALNRSIKSNTSIYIAKSWIILGKIAHMRGENKKALSFFAEAEQLAKSNNLYGELCDAKVSIGEIVYDKGGYDSARVYFMDVGQIAEKYRLDSIRSYSLLYMGKYNETKGNFDKAKELYEHAIRINRKYKDYPQLASLLLSRGKNYLSDGKLNLAMQCYVEAFQISEHLNNRLLYSEACSHLGGLYLQMDQYEKALEYDKKALVNRTGMNNPDGIAKSYNNIGKAYNELKKQDSAFYYFSQSLAFCKKIDYQKGMVKALTNIGRILIDQDKDTQALQYLNEAYAISSRLGYGVGIAESSLALADYYQKVLQQDKAIYYYHLSLKKVQTTGYDEILEGIYRGLFECYILKGDYKSALENHIELLRIEKRLLNVENNHQLALLNISFDSERKDKDNQMLKADNEVKELLIKRKNILMWLVVSALGFTIVLCFAIYNRLYANRKANTMLTDLNAKITHQNNELATLNKELEKANHEKDKLFTIISHELRNPLYWFQNLAEVLSKNFRQMKPEKVQKSLSALDESAKNAFHLMDNLLQWSRSRLKLIYPKKSKHELFELVSDTIDMYRTIMTHKELSIFNEVGKNIIVYADADLLCCVIRNLVSNAVKYTPTQGRIWIESSVTEDTVTVAIIDSGIGIPNANLSGIFDKDITSMPGLLEEKGSGLGLKLCKEFVELNGGKIWANNMAGMGTQFCFTLQVYRTSYIDAEKLEMVLN